MEMKWQLIETAPLNGLRIITLVKGYKPTIGWYQNGHWTNDQKVHSDPIWEREYFITGGIKEGYNPTHWMPLPEPPCSENTTNLDKTTTNPK